NLNAGNRRSLMACLDEKGLFYAKKSIEQVAAILNVSRATSYNDLQTVRKTASTRKKRIIP
ncbi:MAG: helix-turn-helix domain-containing protein, partial [Desulfobacterales bacterium]|nr:helix-turn-helix domain-containing protein [Desulfobacterales bacterium]